jgi:hypothetical protein
MIMKKFILFVMLAFVTFSANAQTAVQTSKVLDNMYVGVNGGVTTPLDFNSMFPVNAAAGLKLGKEFTPVVGVEVEDFVTFGDNHFMDSKTFVKTNNLMLNGKINLSNLLCDYLGHPRKFELSTNTGLGWQHRYGVITRDDDELIAKTGLDLAFNFGDSHSLVISPNIFWNLTNKKDAVHFNKNFGQLGLSIGYIYHFPTSNGTHAFKLYNIGEYEHTIAKLNEELAKKPREVVNRVFVDRVVKVPADMVLWVPFAFDKAELSVEAKQMLDGLKNVESVNVDGYASWEDGSNAEHNKSLSIARANAVTNYLQNVGVKVHRNEGHGATSTTSQRCVIITLVK